MKNALRTYALPAARRALCLAAAGLDRSGLRRLPRHPVVYVSEKQDWAIRWVGRYSVAAIEARHPGTIRLTDRPFEAVGRIAHFGSQFLWQAWAPALTPGTRALITYFHGKPDDGPEMARHVDFFLAHRDRLAAVHTAAGKIRRRLIEWGLAPDKVVHVPIGIEAALFRFPSPEERRAARARFGVPEGAVCIGSFQKDGVGWGDGMQPKLVKGPDLFIEAVGRLARDFPVHVLLTGPARGYVKQGLERLGVSFSHQYLADYRDLANAYHALDLYLMTSREEGGPFCLLESMASGVPLVTTRVGMAEDFVEDGVNAALVEVGDMAAIVGRAARVLAEPAEAAAWRQAGRATAEAHDWSITSARLYRDLYAPLMAR